MKSKHLYNSDKASNEELQSPDKFHCTIAITGTKMFVFMVKIIYQCALNGLITQDVLFHCVCDKQLSNAAMAPVKLKRYFTTNHG